MIVHQQTIMFRWFSFCIFVVFWIDCSLHGFFLGSPWDDFQTMSWCIVLHSIWFWHTHNYHLNIHLCLYRSRIPSTKHILSCIIQESQVLMSLKKKMFQKDLQVDSCCGFWASLVGALAGLGPRRCGRLWLISTVNWWKAMVDGHRWAPVEPQNAGIWWDERSESMAKSP